MSWSISFMGAPAKVVEALEAHSEKLNGQSKVEYDSAVPHMVGLVKEIFGEEGAIVKVAASGHGSAVDGEQKNRTISATVERIYGILV